MLVLEPDSGLTLALPSPGPAVEAPVALDVTGHVPRACDFSLQALQRLPRQAMGPTQILCFTGRHVAQVESYAGARLIDILDVAGLSELPRSERKRCVVLADGRDGYQAIFSWNELYNSPVGPKVLVLYERNAQPLDAHLGDLCLISAHDLRMGPRHLRHLYRVTVKKL